MSTTLNKIVFGSVAVSATTLMALGATPVQAAQMTGFLNISSGTEVFILQEDDITSMDFDESQEPEGEIWVNIGSGTGDFAQFKSVFKNPNFGEISDVFDIEGLSVENSLENFFSVDGLSVDLIGGSAEESDSGSWTMNFDGIAYLEGFDATDVTLQFTTQNSDPSSWSATIEAKSVPEPATMAGLSMVAVGMALAGRRKKA